MDTIDVATRLLDGGVPSDRALAIELDGERIADARLSVQAGSADVATLAIPPDLHRDRDFEIDCRFDVRLPADAVPPAVGATVWLQLLDAHTCFYKNEELVA